MTCSASMWVFAQSTVSRVEEVLIGPGHFQVQAQVSRSTATAEIAQGLPLNSVHVSW